MLARRSCGAIFRGDCVRRGRLPHADRTSPGAASARVRRSLAPRSAAGDDRAPTRSSAPRVPALRWVATRNLGRARATRSPDPVCASRRTARAMGRVDADRRPSRRFRGAFGGFHSGLGAACGNAPSRHRLRDAYARCRDFLDRRCRARRAATFRRALRDPASDCRCGAQRQGPRTASRCDRNDGRSRARARGVRSRRRSRRPRLGERANRREDAPRRRGRHRLRRARAGNEPLRVAAGVRG